MHIAGRSISYFNRKKSFLKMTTFDQIIHPKPTKDMVLKEERGDMKRKNEVCLSQLELL